MKTEKFYSFTYIQKPFEAYPRSAIVKTDNFRRLLESLDQYGITILRCKQISAEDFSRLKSNSCDLLDIKYIKEVNLNKYRKNV